MKKLIFAILLFLSVFADSYSQQSIRIGEGNVYYIGGDSNYFKFNKLGFFPFGLKIFGSSTFYGSTLFSSANLTVSNAVLGVTGTGYIAEGGTNINLIYGAMNDTNYWKRKQTMDSLLIGSGLLLWKNGQIFSSSSLNVNSITTSSDTTADLVVTHTGKFNGSDLDWTGATHTGFNAVKISVDTITAPDEIVNIYGGFNVLAGGYPIFGRTENQNISFTRHHSDGDLLSFQISSTGPTLSYWDSTSNTTTALKVGNGTITANDSVLATRNWVNNNIVNRSNTFNVLQNFTGITNSGKIIESKYRVTTLEYDTATVSDFAIDLDATSDTVNAFLPLASGSEGLIISYTAIDVTYPITIYANGSDLINDGENGNVVLVDKYATRTFRCLNGKWRITAYSKPGDL